MTESAARGACPSSPAAAAEDARLAARAGSSALAAHGRRRPRAPLPDAAAVPRRHSGARRPAAERGSRRDHDRVHDDGRRTERRRRLRGAARPWLRRVLRGRRVYGGVVRLGAVRAGDLPLRLGRRQPRAARDPHVGLADPHPRRLLHRARRNHHRPADAAPPRRLPRDRDARLRRRSSRSSSGTPTASRGSTSRTARSGSRRSTRPDSARR